MRVRTRFAPSPTGTPESIHLGFVIRALWNYAFAKKNGGDFILRIEDTDQKRSRKDVENKILDVLLSFGINWDEGPDIGGAYGPYRQSERLEKYKLAAFELVRKGYAYFDFEAVKRDKDEIKASYESENFASTAIVRSKARADDSKIAWERVEKGEEYVVRVKIPESRVFAYDDWILKKKVIISGKEVPDLILLKSDGFPTYHLAVVVDDIDMKVSHVFRGQEWISSTPIHLYLYEGLGSAIPEIGHFTVILDPRTGKKFSKRDMSAMFGVDGWVDRGYLRGAILNYLMLLGWAPKDNQEIFSLEQFVQSFDQSGVQKANPTFNPKKLDWFNQQYIKMLNVNDLAKQIQQYSSLKKDDINKILPLVRDRLVTLCDFEKLTEYFFQKPHIDWSILNKVDVDSKLIINNAMTVLNDQWDGQYLEKQARAFCANNNIKVGDYFMILRILVTGSSQTPPIWDVMQILGKQESLERLSINSLTS